MVNGRRMLLAHSILTGALLLLGCAQTATKPLKTAIFYGKAAPVEALSRYDRVVLEAEHFPQPPVFAEQKTEFFAYVSVGEAESWRASARALPPDLFLGANTGWDSRIADLTKAEWVDFLIEKRMASLWQQGYRGFFLDTLDSYRIVIKDSEGQSKQADALIKIVYSIHRRFPGVQLLVNRGFDILPEVGHLVVGVVAESLFRGWDPVGKHYVSVNENGRSWLIDQLRTAATRYRLPVTVIDYVPPNEPDLANDTAKRIQELGFAAWIATPLLDTLSLEQTK